MKKTLLISVCLILALLSAFFVYISVSAMMEEITMQLPQTNTDSPGKSEEQEPEQEPEQPPTEQPDGEVPAVGLIEYTYDDFRVMEPVFSSAQTQEGTEYGIRFRAYVSDTYKAALDTIDVSYHVVIAPFDYVEDFRNQIKVDWVLALGDSAVKIDVVNGIEKIEEENLLSAVLTKIKYANTNRVMVGIPYVQYSDGTRQYAFLPEGESYFTVSRSYAYLCSEAYTNQVCNGYYYTSDEMAAFKEGLTNSVNLANGKAESEIDVDMKYTLSLPAEIYTLPMTEALVLTVTISPDVLLYYGWQTDNAEVVAVDEDHMILPMKPGNAKVRVRLGEIKAECLISVIDPESADNITCENCKHLYYPGDVDACPKCGLRAYEMYVRCDSDHCDGGFKATIYRIGDGRFWRGDTAVECEACNCIWNYNRDTELFEIGYHCVYDATHMEERTGTCSCCGSAMTWQVECNYDGEWVSDDLEAYCTACECLYTVVLPNGEGLVPKMHCDTCTHYVICQHCADGYCTEQNNACPNCGAVIQQKSIVCHCESGVVVEWTYVNGEPIADCPPASCSDCLCTYVVNSLDLVEAIYDCRVDIGVTTEDHSITCTCCTVTVPFEIQVNCFGTYVQEEIYLNCSGCTCRYAVSVSSDTYITARVYNCNGYGIVTHPETREGACVHCAEILTWTIQCKPNGTWNGANVAVTCGDCGCKFRASGDGSQLTRTYDCILDARILKTKSAACAHCNATISWQTYFNGADQWHSDSVIVDCGTCYCVYTVGGNGDTLALMGSEVCNYGGQCVHCGADLSLEDHCCTVCGAEHSPVKVRCECCSEYITYFIGYNNEGDRVMPYDVACPTCDCLYSVSGADCDELIKKQNH
ncbi:MAG: hypothetical protein E7650_06680 [Ruminococcaceae bacterium]|nr:hypothetical protein [Oscillospiraceae bacterium]